LHFSIGSLKNFQAQKGLIVSKAMVVSAREEASQIGIDIIKKVEMPLMLWLQPNWHWQ
jgi:hypothetical protein